jgi:hypothetical protein
MADAFIYDIEYVLKGLERIDQGINQVNQKLERGGAVGGQRAGRAAALGIDRELKSAGPQIASTVSGIFSVIGINQIGSLVRSSVGAFNQAQASSKGLEGVVNSIINRNRENLKVINDTNSSYERQALAIGFPVDKLYETVSASKQAKDSTIPLTRAVNQLERQEASLEKQLDSIKDKYEEQIDVIEGQITLKESEIRTINESVNGKKDELQAIDDTISSLREEAEQRIRNIQIQRGFDSLNQRKNELEIEKNKFEITEKQAKVEGDIFKAARFKEKADLKSAEIDLAKNQLDAIKFETDAVKEQADVQIDAAASRKKSIEDSIKQYERQKNVIEASIQSLKTQIDQQKFQLKIDTKPLEQNIDAIRDRIKELNQQKAEIQVQFSAGGSTQVLSQDFQKALASAKKGLGGDLNVIDPEKQKEVLAKVRNEVDTVFNGIGRKAGVTKDVIENSFIRVFSSGVTDIDAASSAVQGFITVAGSNSRIPLSDAVDQLSQQFETQNASLGETAGLTDEYVNDIIPRGLATLQAYSGLTEKQVKLLAEEEQGIAQLAKQGDFRGKTVESLTAQERSLAKVAGLQKNVNDAQARFDSKLTGLPKKQNDFNFALRETSKALGDAYEEPLSAILDLLNPFLDRLSDFITNNQQLFVSLTAIAGGFLLANAALSLFGTNIIAVLVGALNPAFLTTAFSGLSGVFAQALGFPIIAAVKGAFVAAFTGIPQFFTTIIPGLLAGIGPVISTVFSTIFSGQIFGIIGTAISTGFTSLFLAAQTALTSFAVFAVTTLAPFLLIIGAVTAAILLGIAVFQDLQQNGKAWEPLGALIQKVFGDILKIVQEVFKYLVDSLNPLIEQIKTEILPSLIPVFFFIIKAVEALLPVVRNVFFFIVDIITTATRTVIDVVSGILKFFGGFFDLLVGLFTGNTDKVQSGFLKMFEGLGQALGGIFRGVGNVIIDAINLVIRNLKSFTQNLNFDIPGIGNIKDKFQFQELKRLATGGSFTVPDNAAFTGDRFLFAANAGERVTVQSRREVAAGDNSSNTTNYNFFERPFLYNGFYR